MAVKCEVHGCINRAGSTGVCGDHVLEQHLSRIPVELFDIEPEPTLDRTSLTRMSARGAILAVLRSADRELTLRELQVELDGVFSASRVGDALQQLIGAGDVLASANQGIALNGRPVDRFQLAGALR